MFISFLTILICQGFSQQSSYVAVIDPIKALESSVEGKKAMVLLFEKEQQIKKNLTELDSQVQDIEKRLRTQKLTLSLEAEQKLKLSLDSLITKRKRYEEDALKEYNQLKFELFTKFRDEILPIIANVAKEKGFHLVLDLSLGGVAYFSPEFDITEEVVRRYDISKAEKK